jgi:hypothetical protein
MHQKFRQRVKGAETDVVCDPNDQKPARPVAAAEHKHSAKNREQPDQANPDDAVCERTLCVELRGMVGKPDGARGYEQATNDGD